MADTKLNLKSEAAKTLYAGAGVVDLAVEVVRDYVSSTQAKATEVQKKARPSVVRDSLSKEAKERRAAIESRISELQAEAKALPDRAEETYADLAKRGESLVSRIRKQESTQEAIKEAKVTKSRAKATSTSARKTATAAKTTAKTAKTQAENATGNAATKGAATTTRKSAATTKSTAKSTVTAAKKTVAAAGEAVKDAAEKVGD